MHCHQQSADSLFLSHRQGFSINRMKAYAVIVVAAASLAVIMGVTESAPRVATEEGMIEGKEERTISGRLFHSFYSIPYAMPPLGARRFKDPVPHPRQHGLVNATTMPPPCLQVKLISMLMMQLPSPDQITGTEDCLFLNVFTPLASPTSVKGMKPVMVWLHGGGFFSGDASEYLPHALLDHDVVLVVVQYRLGVLGFLSTEDLVMPGNLGLKDQTLALQWVQENIHYFGGDKTRVTIFGESAGASSVHYQILTPKAKGLFSRAIMQSGTALAPWALNLYRHREAAEEIGRNQGCEDVYNSTSLLECLQRADAKHLTHAILGTYQWFLMPATMVPRVDGDYLPDSPAALIAQKRYNDVNLMAGVTRSEGLLFALPVQSMLNDLVNQFNTYGPISTGTEKEKNAVALSRYMYRRYLDENIPLSNQLDNIAELYGDIFFYLDHDEVTKHHAIHFPGRGTFRYQFDYRGTKSFSLIFGYSDNSSVFHLDDLIYLFPGGSLFGLLHPNGLTDPQDLAMRETMLRLWTNFAKFGNPTPDDYLGFKWEPSTYCNLHYLSITPTPCMQPDSRQQEREFFNSLPLTKSKTLYPWKQQQQQQQQQQPQQPTRRYLPPPRM